MLIEQELDMVKLKFESLRATNETLSRKLKFEKEKATNESSKRIKVKSSLPLSASVAASAFAILHGCLFVLDISEDADDRQKFVYITSLTILQHSSAFYFLIIPLWFAVYTTNLSFIG